MLVPKDKLFSTFQIAGRGMEAQRIALGAATENIANASTTTTADGTPYQVKRAVHETDRRYARFGRLLTQARLELQRQDSRHLDGNSLLSRLDRGRLGPQTEVEEIEQIRLEYDPEHPDARPDGYVEYPDVNVVEEMAHMMSANRIYEANLTTVQAAKEMIKRTLEI